jgi:hypothetical protein
MRKRDVRSRWRDNLFATRGGAGICAALFVPFVSAVVPQRALAQVVADGTTVVASGTISVPGGAALQALNGGIIESFTPLTVNGSFGGTAQSGGMINIASGSAITADVFGFEATGPATINIARRSTITNDLFGLVANGQGATINIIGSTIDTGDTALITGIAGTNSGVGATINVVDSTIITTGRGAGAQDGGTINITGSTIQTSGSDFGLFSSGTGSALNLTNTQVTSTNSNASGLLVQLGATASLVGSSLTSAGTAMQERSGSGTIILTDSTISAGNGIAVRRRARLALKVSHNELQRGMKCARTALDVRVRPFLP